MAHSFTLTSISYAPQRVVKSSSLLMVVVLLSSLILAIPASFSLPQFVITSPSMNQAQPTTTVPELQTPQFANGQNVSAVLYQAFAEGNNWVMMNQAQQFEAQFDGAALSLALGAEHAWGLQLASFGRDGALLSLPAEAQLVAQGSELQYVWSDSLREWYINSPTGIEHGYTVASRPSGEGDLVVTLDVLGNLSPVMSSNGISFVDSANQTVINYDKLLVYDAHNVEQAAHFVLAGEQIQIVVDDRAAQYPLTIDPLVLRNPATKASPSVGYERLGSSIAVYDNVMVVGASEASVTTPSSMTRVGAAYVFTRNGTGWTMQQRIVNPNPSTNDYFGNSVAIENGVIAIGSPYEDSSGTGVAETITDNSSASDRGAVYLYKQVEGVWTLSHFVKPPTGTTPLTYRNFGEQVVLDEGRLFVSEPATDTTMNYAHNGTVHMFTADGNGGWAYDSSITASDGVVKDRFGYGFAVEGDTIAVGAPYHNSIQGAVYVFTYDGSAWVQQAKLTADDGEANDQFGHTVAIHDKFVFASAIGWDMSSSYQNAGAVYVFKYDEGAWVQAQKLSGPSTGNAQFGSGRNMLVAGDTLLIASPSHNDMFYNVYGGSVYPAYQYANTGDTWNLATVTSALKTSTNVEFGKSMAYDPINYTLVVGGPKDGSASAGYESGAVYTYDLLGQAQVSYNGVSFSSSTSASITNGTAFGNVALNQTVTHTFIVSNTIEGKLIWGEPAYTVSNAAFSVNVPSTTTLLKGESTTFTISFTPTALQNYTGNVQLQFPGANNFYINVSGTGSANQIALTGNGNAISVGSTTTATSNNTDFASVNVGSTKTLNYTIANAGGVPLNISNISLSGADAAQFSISNAPTSVAAGGNATFSVTYAPNAASTHNATVTIASDNTSTPSYSFAIAGQGLAPSIEVLYNSTTLTSGNTSTSSATGTALGDVLVGANTSQTFTVANTGELPLTISDVSISGAQASDFTIVSKPTTIAVGDSAPLQVRFDPSAIGVRNATITITSDAINTPSFNFAIAGTGTAANIAVTNSSNQAITNGNTAISFSNVALGSNGTGSFTISNNGNLPLTLNVSVGGSNASNFAIVSAPSSIAAGASATVQVRFTPNALGSHNATINVASNALNTPSLSFALTGNGTAALIAVTNSSNQAVANGQVAIAFGETQTGSFTIRNNGNLPLTLNLSVGGSNASDFTIVSAPSSIAAGASATVQVRFTPSAVGSRSATLTITNNSYNQASFSVGLTGTSSTPPVFKVFIPQVTTGN